MHVKKQQFKSDMEKLTGSKSGKEYVKAVYCHPAYLTYMQSTSCEMLGWLNHRLESRLTLGKIEGKRRRRCQRNKWLDGITDSLDMNLSRLWELVKGRGAWHAIVHEVAEWDST